MEVHTSIPCKAIHYRDRISASSYTNNNSCQGIGLGTATPKCLPWTDLKIRRNKALVGKQRCEEKKNVNWPKPEESETQCLLWIYHGCTHKDTYVDLYVWSQESVLRFDIDERNSIRMADKLWMDILGNFFLVIRKTDNVDIWAFYFS